MNFLAHAYLSFQHDEILAGNMISDFVKGRKRYDYSQGIQNGIELHRRIDAFTDTHPLTAEAKKYFQAAANRYAGAFVDVAYDHFPATDTDEFTQSALMEFAHYVYETLDRQSPVLPDRFRDMLPYMRTQNWLYNYSNHTGIERSFEGLVKRAAYLKDSKPAYKVFILYSENLRLLYQKFFPELKTFAFNQLQTLLTQSQ